MLLQAKRHLIMRFQNFPYSTKSVWLAALLVVVFCGPLFAENSQEVQDLLKQRLDSVLVVLQDQKLSFEAKKAEVSKIVTPMFDFPLMAKLTLGREYWTGLTPEQKERFTQLFIDRLRTSYLARITLYTDEKVVYRPSVKIKQKIHIPTDLVSKDKMISILYKFHESGSSWKIYDLEIQGVSIIRSYRSQFHQFLKSGTIDDLLAKLEKPAED